MTDYDVEKYGSIYDAEGKRMVMMAAFEHPDDDATCSFCNGMINEYRGKSAPLGSDSHLEFAGPWHSSCRYWESYEVLPISDVKFPPRILEAIPADSPRWNIAAKSIWPLAVWYAMIRKEKEKPKPEKYEPINYKINENDVEAAKDDTLRYLRQGKAIDWIRLNLYGKYGETSTEVAFGDLGI